MKQTLRTALGTLLTGSLLALAGAASAEGAQEGKKVIFLGADDICEYCAVYNGQIRKLAAAAGIDLEVVTNKFDAAQQATQIDQAIAKKPDAILLWTIDGTALFPSMRKVKRAGIPLLLTDVQPDQKMDDLWVQYSGGNYEEQGAKAAQLMVKAFDDKGMEKKGGVILITGIIGQAQTISMTKGFTETLAKLAPDLTILGSQPGNWDTGTSTQAAAGLFTKYGDQIKGVYAAEDIMMQGVLIAAERAGMDPTKMAMIGGGCEPVGIQNIKSGKQYGTVLQSPVDEATYAVQSLTDYFNGKEMAKSHYVPHPMVTAANVDQVCKPWPKD
ncbi:sugar ABC transporter substrate-binding protein [Pseudooceanicola sp. CBS1P-1]|uniref:Substrate-binding domain-containing protein n=1 Tax=Pseudooceanicola albus TaxID=2692189 RepID=A0A6L7G451_9RHOB|nr:MULTISPECIES: sugar ABC transporter substrate-binding protein [Pseudooceanicola]MBT9383568.1 sugar ABC transporter substrate-binding protein [Pseudooceanicola endophyticus]MXN17423.1 substrate-binding domain-containing protein [Pseudooceanicola albus]